MPTRTFRDIVAWQRAMELARWACAYTVEPPEVEKFGLAMQIRQAPGSVPSNIAEGYERFSRRDFVRFPRVARGSLCELPTQVELAQGLFEHAPAAGFVGFIQRVDRVAHALIRSPNAQLEDDR